MVISLFIRALLQLLLFLQKPASTPQLQAFTSMNKRGGKYKERERGGSQRKQASGTENRDCQSGERMIKK